MKLSIKAGATSQSVNIFVRDSSSTTGAGLASVAPAGGALLSGTKLYYSFTGANASAGVAVSLSVLAAVNSAYSSGGIVTIDGTNMIGFVRVDLPDASITTGKGRVVSFLLFGGTNMAPTPFEIELTGWDNQDAVRGGLTAIPNVAAGGDGSIMVQGATQTPTLKSLTISNSAGDALTLSSTGSNGNGLNASGNGSGDGIKATGGSTGRGGHFLGGATSGAGLRAEGVGSGIGIHAVGVSNNAGAQFDGSAAVTTTPAAAGLALNGGAASTGAGGTAAAGLVVTGGAGAASANGAASGATFTGGGTNTVGSTASGLVATGTSNGHGVSFVHAGTGSDFNATTTPLVLAKTTNITGFNDIAATAIVSSGAITTSGGAVVTTTNLTNLPSIPNNWLTAAGIAAGALNGKGDWFVNGGAFSCTTFTASGAVAFQSTFAVTTSTSLSALSCTTLTASGAVALQSTLAVTGNFSVTGGITVTQSTLNGHGISVTGNGTGNGIISTSGSGATGDGVHFVAASTVGNGMYCLGNGGGDGAEFTATNSINASGAGLHCQGISGTGTGIIAAGAGTGDGISAIAAGTGRGMHCTGGATSGAGFRAEGTAGNANGMEFVANGTGKDLFLNTSGNNTALTIAASEVPLKKNTALNAYEFMMVLSSDHVTPATGLTVTGQVSINGAAFASLTNAVSEVGSGIYKVNLAAADTNGDTITFKFTAATADQTTISHLTQ